MLLIGAERAILSLGSRRLTHSYEIPAGEAGWATFGRHLQDAPDIPTRVVVDIVEEEYRQDTIPHVRGADRRAVLGRKYSRLFRGTPYTLALAQGRERDGRRDDRVLLTALTKPENVAPWIQELIDHQTPVTGIYSLPVLSSALLGKLKAVASNVLIVSVQQASGLRQTFFRDRQLKISRLAQMPRLGSVPYASHVIAELGKLRRYLNSLALISRDSPLAIYILSHGTLLGELADHCRNTEAEQYFLVDNADLAPRLGLSDEFGSAYADAIFGQLVVTDPPREHYAQRSETRYYRLHRAKLGLLAASMLLLIGSAGWSALRFIEAVGLKQQAVDAANKSAFYQTRFEMARRGLPHTAVDAPAIEAAVKVAGMLHDRKDSPMPLLRVIGAELATLPGITVGEIRWFQATDPTQTDAGKTASDPSPVIPMAEQYAAQYAIAVVAARLEPFAGDYRGSIAEIDALVARLRAREHVFAVDVVSYPLDLRSANSMSGNASAHADN
ncbi:MAG: hypothetical protein ACREXT_14010, partial [Gammaproteobacteria bacterium]